MTCRGFHGQCPHAPARQGLCWGHLKRQQRHRSIDVELRPRLRTPKERVHEAILDYLDAKTSDGAAWERTWHRIRMAMRRYVEAPKVNDPRGKDRQRGVHVTD